MSELPREAYTALCLKLGNLLAAGGITVERPVTQRGNVVDWEPVDASSIIIRLSQAGYRVRESVPDLEARVLTIAPRDPCES